MSGDLVLSPDPTLSGGVGGLGTRLEWALFVVISLLWRYTMYLMCEYDSVVIHTLQWRSTSHKQNSDQSG